jgi:TRAP transporter 4TM/12TM fusion protein
MAIHYRAAQRGLAGNSEQVSSSRLVDRIHLLAPIVVIVAFLALGRSPMRAAFWGVITAAAAAAARLDTRFDAAGWGRALVAGAGGTVQVAAACATAGIVVGVASLTGIGLRMSELIVTVAQGHLFVALVLTALGSIVIGMGLPTTAAYVVLAALGAPALTELGVPLLAAHLFIFYFGCLSNITPPVALAAYAAAGVAGAPPLRTGFAAMGIAIGGFVVPFAFVYDPLLLLDGSPAAVAAALVGAGLGAAALAAAIVGFLGSPVPIAGRVVLAGSGVALLAPGLASDVLGVVLFGAALWLWRARPAGTETPENAV